ncbi:MAG: NB-ARC domain-containing protein, partial [Actinomycetota bacterium]|nr:NB-ARC domain-containing protein [Actinomycetota bacterium]
MGSARAEEDLSRSALAGPAIPAALTALIGRTPDLDGVSEALRRCRLVTVSGPGGVGKTSLATEVARRQVPRRLDGVWLVDLTGGPRTPEVATETARALGVQPPSGTTAIDALRRYLADRDALLVLDNCEHVIDECAQVAGALLRSCPQVRILATSREPLGVSGETVWRLEPLAPEDARRLFVDRARQRSPQFLPDEDTELAIRTLCERLDRLPLAIELAAARTSAMSPREILAGLEARLDELGAVRRQAPAHHRSVRAAVEWSHHLLDPTEQAAFRQLAVFVGGFNAEAAMAVAPGLSLEVLARLVDKSVVTVVPPSQGRTRYRMLETVREYASELLVAAGDLDNVRQRHFRHFLSLGHEVGDRWRSMVMAVFPQPGSTGPSTFVDELEADYGNIRAALEWAAVADPCAGLRLLARMQDLFLVLGQADGRRLAGVVLERCPTRDRTRAHVQLCAGVLAWWTGDPDAARRILTETRDLGAELGEREIEGWAWAFEGLLEVFGGSPSRARRNFEEARRLHHELGVRSGEARSTAAIGLTFLLENDPARAGALVREALEIAVALDDGFAQGQSHTYLGMIAQASADDRSATSHYRSAVACLRPYRDVTLLPFSLVGQAVV